MKRLLTAVSALLIVGGAAFATQMDDLKKDGYSCDRGGVDSIVCTKTGSPTKYCDNSGKCTRTTAGAGGVTGGTAGVAGAKTFSAKKKNSIKGNVATSAGGFAELTADECTRLGGEVTGNGDPNCKSNQRCKMTLANGDLRSICIDEVAQ